VALHRVIGVAAVIEPPEQVLAVLSALRFALGVERLERFACGDPSCARVLARIPAA
jgi:hypothetical protein